MSVRAAMVSVLLWGGGSASLAQSHAVDVRYSAPQLNCAQFLETAESDIQTETSGRILKQTAGRRGVWQFRAKPAVDGVSLEGWLDSLSLWRKSRETTIRPDTDGLLGGRYRGALSGSGAYLSQARPFVPDEVAEIAGMATALDDFFPPLPPRLLRPEQAWSDASGVMIRRMADSGMSGTPLYRFELEVRREARSNPMPNDTASLRLRQLSREHGTFVWHPLLGLLRRDRRIVVETSVPAGRAIRQPVRSRVEQRITVLRDLTIPPEHNGPC
ncbi:MAG TPA: hypothetical protein VGQ24_08395 [Gemmatimonadales bacterium]|nr:hypothetical protein [Gemmatimonadales bacterium]